MQCGKDFFTFSIRIYHLYFYFYIGYISCISSTWVNDDGDSGIVISQDTLHICANGKCGVIIH